jgi:hypothetical protein
MKEFKTKDDTSFKKEVILMRITATHQNQLSELYVGKDTDDLISICSKRKHNKNSAKWGNTSSEGKSSMPTFFLLPYVKFFKF